MSTIKANTVQPTTTNANLNLNPDGSGAVIVDGLTFPTADGSANQYLKTDGSGNLDWVTAGGGKVGQVVQTTKTDTTSTTSTSAADITGMSVAITPSATSSKVLINFDVQGSADQSSGQNYHFHLLRATSAIFQGDAASSRTRCTVQGAESDGNGSSIHKSMMFLDSPSSTSALTYKLQWEVQSGTLYLNREHADGDDANAARFVSQITVMEILA